MTSETASPPVMIGLARLVSPTAPPTSSSTAVSTEMRRISPSISGRARMAACVVVAMGAMTLGSMPAANRAAMPARSAPAARRSATRSASNDGSGGRVIAGDAISASAPRSGPGVIRAA